MSPNGKRDKSPWMHYIFNMSRFAKLALVFVVLLPVLGLPAAWFLSGAVLRHSFEAWVQDRRDDGYALRQVAAQAPVEGQFRRAGGAGRIEAQRQALVPRPPVDQVPPRCLEG